MGQRHITDALALNIIYQILNGRDWNDALDVISEVMIDTGRDLASPGDPDVDWPESHYDAWDVRQGMKGADNAATS